MRMCGHAHHDDMLFLGREPKPSWDYPDLGDGGYVDREAYAFWAARDPLKRYARRLERRARVRTRSREHVLHRNPLGSPVGPHQGIRGDPSLAMPLLESGAIHRPVFAPVGEMQKVLVGHVRSVDPDEVSAKHLDPAPGGRERLLLEPLGIDPDKPAPLAR